MKMVRRTAVEMFVLYNRIGNNIEIRKAGLGWASVSKYSQLADINQSPQAFSTVARPTVNNHVMPQVVS
jgi:hypothetical protein